MRTFAASFNEHFCQCQTKAPSAARHDENLAFKIKVTETLRRSLRIRETLSDC